MLSVDHVKGTFKTDKLARLQVERRSCCLATDSERYVWVLGGCEFTNAVSKYDSVTNTFDDTIPSLRLAANKASACYIDGVIYVVGGIDGSKNAL